MFCGGVPVQEHLEDAKPLFNDNAAVFRGGHFSMTYAETPRGAAYLRGRYSAAAYLCKNTWRVGVPEGAVSCGGVPVQKHLAEWLWSEITFQ